MKFRKHLPSSFSSFTSSSTTSDSEVSFCDSGNQSSYSCEGAIMSMDCRFSTSKGALPDRILPDRFVPGGWTMQSSWISRQKFVLVHLLLKCHLFSAGLIKVGR